MLLLGSQVCRRCVDLTYSSIVFCSSTGRPRRLVEEAGSRAVSFNTVASQLLLSSVRLSEAITKETVVTVDLPLLVDVLKTAALGSVLLGE